MIDRKYPEHVAVIGGGRWARVIADTLHEILPHATRISLCSYSNPDGWQYWIEKQGNKSRRQLAIASPNDLLADATLQHCFIARAARQHATTACWFLQAGKNVFIEKPFALSQSEADEVCVAAAGRDCRTSLVFLYHQGLLEFVRLLPALDFGMTIELEWSDARSEFRHGEAKAYDPSINSIHDVFSHAWSILRLLDPDGVLQAETVDIARGGRRTTLSLLLGHVPVNLTIEREAEMRRRRLVVNDGKLERSMDFSTIPGAACLGGRSIPLSEDVRKPMALQLEAVLRRDSKSLQSMLCNVDMAKEAIAIAAQLSHAARKQQFAFIESELTRARKSQDTGSLVYAVREIITDRLLNQPMERVSEVSQSIALPLDLASKVTDWLMAQSDDDTLAKMIAADPELSAIRKRFG